MNSGFVSQITPLVKTSFLESLIYIILLIAIGLGVVTSALNVDAYLSNSFNSFKNESSMYEQYAAISNQINTSDLVANSVVFIVWSACGLIICGLLLLIQSSSRSLFHTVKLMLQNKSESHDLMKERALRTVLRLIGVVSLLVSALVGVSIILPLLFVVLNMPESGAITSYVVAIGCAWLLMALLLHGIVISLRFITLRSRLLI